MLRPVGGSGGQRSALARHVLAILLALVCAPIMQAAASQHGASGLPAEAHRTAVTSSEQKVAGGPGEAYGPEQRAQELYLDAMEKLDAGHAAWAQSTFETLIARFPQSTAAGLARRQLGALYRNDPSPETRTAPTQGIAPASTTEATATVGASPVWEQELRRNASIQTRFRNEFRGSRVFHRRQLRAWQQGAHCTQRPGAMAHPLARVRSRDRRARRRSRQRGRELEAFGAACRSCAPPPRRGRR